MTMVAAMLATAVFVDGSAEARAGEREGGWNPAWGQPATSPYPGWPYSANSLWPFYAPSGPAYAYDDATDPTYSGTYRARPRYTYTQTAPVVTGRSVSTGSIGMHCATSVKTCMLRKASPIGGGCSCTVTGGRAYGSVTP
jgi:hypothetical protein